MYSISEDTIIFTDEFNHPIDDNLIKMINDRNIKKIHFGTFYNRPIDNLPSHIEEIIICNQKMPTDVDYDWLHVESFNQPINNLPINLTRLVIHGRFNQPLDYLPPNLETLEIYSRFNHPLTNLPANLKNLYLHSPYLTHSLDFLPPSLENLVIKTPYVKFPNAYNYKIKATISKLTANLEYLFMEGYNPYIETIVKDHNETFNKLVIYDYK